MHYHRYRKHGDPMEGVQKRYAKGFTFHNGYKGFYMNGKQILEHRFVVEQMLGRKLTKGEHVHHINGVKTDNRLENLLVVSNSDHQHIHHKLKFAKTIEEFLPIYQEYIDLSRKYPNRRLNIRRLCREKWGISPSTFYKRLKKM